MIQDFRYGNRKWFKFHYERKSWITCLGDSGFLFIMAFESFLTHITLMAIWQTSTQSSALRLLRRKLIFSKFCNIAGTGNYIISSSNMKLVHYPFMSGILRLLQQRGGWTECPTAQATDVHGSKNAGPAQSLTQPKINHSPVRPSRGLKTMSLMVLALLLCALLVLGKFHNWISIIRVYNCTVHLHYTRSLTIARQ